MKNKVIFTFIIIASSWLSTMAQSKLAINDRIGLIDEAAQRLLEEKLFNKSIEYSNMVDYNDLCRHKFATISETSEGIIISLKDCNDKFMGMRNLGSQIQNSPADEKATILAYNLSELYFATIETSLEPLPSEPEPKPEPEAVNPAPWLSWEQNRKTQDTGYEHDSRYFFAPSAFNLKKGELYYNTIFFGIHDVQYGIDDHFSMGMGTTITTIPFYVTPKFSYSFDEQNHLAVGDMLILGTWSIRAWGNLAYVTYTRGTTRKNFSIGGGHLYGRGDPNTADFNTFSKPIANLSANVQISDYIHFITENYFVPARYTYEVYHRDQNFYKNVRVNNNVLLGFSGFRFVNKNYGVRSWQFGLFYLFQDIEPLASEYQTNPWTTFWGGPDFPRFVIPAISYTQKFGKKY